jgi:prepilin-type processing-associated H-X9-DG protein
VSLLAGASLTVTGCATEGYNGKGGGDTGISSGHYRVYLPAWAAGSYDILPNGQYGLDTHANPNYSGQRDRIRPKLPLMGDANDRSERGDGLGDDDCSYIDAGEANYVGSDGVSNGNRFSDRHYGGANYLFQDLHGAWKPKLREELAREVEYLRHRLQESEAGAAKAAEELKKAIDDYGLESGVRSCWDSCLRAQAQGRLAAMVREAIARHHTETAGAGAAEPFTWRLRVVDDQPETVEAAQQGETAGAEAATPFISGLRVVDDQPEATEAAPRGHTVGAGAARPFISGLRVVVEEARQEAMRAAKYPTRSTCPLTSFADQVKGAISADWYEEWERHLAHLQAKVEELEQTERAANV